MSAEQNGSYHLDRINRARQALLAAGYDGASSQPCDDIQDLITDLCHLADEACKDDGVPAKTWGEDVVEGALRHYLSERVPA